MIQGELLLGVGFIVAIQNTLGATIQAVARLLLAGGISTIYCLCIVNFVPKDIYFAVGATIIFVLLIVYTDLPTIVRRYSMLPTCIILLQWFKDPHVDATYVLHLWASSSLGAGMALIVSCIPFPFVPTAYSELTMRMKFLARQTRREITAIVLLLLEYHNVHRTQSRYNHNDADEIDMPKNSYREDDLCNHSTSFENLKDDYLLKSDIQDLHTIVNEELKQIQRALKEIPYEPYFILLKLVNFIRRVFSRIPFLKRFVNKPSTIQMRLQVWTVGFISLQRTITGILSLDQHHHAFVDQRPLIHAISVLLDTTFNFLDSALPYTTSPNRSINTAHILSCRTKIEEVLEQFFETYSHIYENSRHTTISNTESISLNTFLLLILRIVHVTITAAERSETPGARLESTVDNSPEEKKTNWKKPFCDLGNYIGLKPTVGKFLRAIKTSLSVLVSAIVVFRYRDRLQAYGWVYWAPMTTALVADSSEGGTLYLSFQRLMAVLIGSTYAHIIFLIAQDHLSIGIFISLFVAFMGYIKTDPQKEYFASVCAQSASIITFISNQEGLQGSNRAVLSRTSLTFLGIFVHVLISNTVLPISARALVKKKVNLKSRKKINYFNIFRC